MPSASNSNSVYLFNDCSSSIMDKSLTMKKSSTAVRRTRIDTAISKLVENNRLRLP